MLKKILFALILSILLVKPVYAQSNSEEIRHFIVNYTINKDGTVEVIENIKYYFPTPRHGIFRNIPLVKENQDGDKFVMEVSDLVVKDDDQIPYMYQNNSTDKEINLKIGDPNKTITGEHIYLITYTLSGGLTYFSDHDEFYWNMTGNEWEVPILDAMAMVFVPPRATPNEGVCFVGSYGATDTCEVIREERGRFVFKAENLLPGEGLTFGANFPTGFAAVLEPIPDNSDFIDTIIAIAVAIFSLAWYLILPGYLIFKALKKRKKTPEEKRVVSAWFEPPKTKGGRELTAGEVGVLHDRKGDVRDITATLIQLAQKGYFKISSAEEGFIIKKPAFTLIKRKEWLNSDLQPYEIELLEDIFDGKEAVKLSELSKRIGFATKLDKAYKAISMSLVSDGLYEEDPHTTKQKWYGLMVVGFIFFNPLFIAAAALMANAAKRTNAGGGAWAVVESMKNFVKSQEKQLEFQAKNQMFFEKLLPYATALGVEKVWIERFKDLKFAQPDWLETDSFNTFAYMNLMNSFNSSVSSAVSMSSTRSSSGFSSGFSGGGFSGGGGGGGGGGSW